MSLTISESTPIKGLSLWQPWASLIAVGAKTIETRGWKTNYRGLVAIHAAKRRKVDEINYYLSTRAFSVALAEQRVDTLRYERRIEGLPFGAFVCLARLVECRPTELFTVAELDTKTREYCQRDFGNFEPGRFGWILETVWPLKQAVPAKGMQGLFSISTATRDEIFKELPI